MWLQKLKEICERGNCGKILTGIFMVIVSVAIISFIGTVIGLLFFEGCYMTTGM